MIEEITERDDFLFSDRVYPMPDITVNVQEKKDIDLGEEIKAHFRVQPMSSWTPENKPKLSLEARK